MSSGGEVVIKITGDDSEYEKKLNELEKKAKKTASAIDQVTKSSEKAGSAINDILTARDVFADRLNTMDIRANGFLQMMVGDATVWRVEITSSNADVLTDGSSTTLSARVYQGAIERTGEIAAACFRWRRSGDDPDADAIWNAAHRGVKSVTVSGGDVRYNAVYSCDIYTNIENGSIIGECALGSMKLGYGGD